jgi:DNA-binding HxlR family transcriptional regulator
MSWFERLFRRAAGRRRPVEMDPHQQLAVRALFRFGPRSFNELYEEVRAIRPATQAEMANAILKLEADGILSRPSDPGRPQAQRRYVLSNRGMRIARHIPADPRSTIEFHV